MVLINNKKYSCETCIKGHRSSTCKHTERPLFEIKKKGRPVTQCEHCRELRKTKQVHVKCLCEARSKTTLSCGSRHGHDPLLEPPVYPNGLSEALEASITMGFPIPAQTADLSSDSDGFVPCSCGTGAECHCCTPRQSAPRVRKKKVDLIRSTSTSASAEHNDTLVREAPHHIVSRISGLRPVLPRPVHEDLYFNPYNRAYDHAHPVTSAESLLDLTVLDHIPTSTSSKNEESTSTSGRSSRAGEYDTNMMSWDIGSTLPPASCGCGDACACPGCTQHQTGIAAPNSSCSNPATCGACFNCNILDLSSGSLPSDVTEGSTTSFIDDWIRQLSDSHGPVISSDTAAISHTPDIFPDVGENTHKPRSLEECTPGCGCPPGYCHCVSEECNIPNLFEDTWRDTEVFGDVQSDTPFDFDQYLGLSVELPRTRSSSSGSRSSEAMSFIPSLAGKDIENAEYFFFNQDEGGFA